MHAPLIGMVEVAEDVPRASDLRGAVDAERLWVTQIGAEVAGYITAEVIDGNAHVAQVSVAPVFAGRALGRAMIEFVEQWGRAAGRPATTLTTFRDVPWNAPYYFRLGYRVLPNEDVGPELARTMAHEASLTENPDPAVAIPRRRRVLHICEEPDRSVRWAPPASRDARPSEAQRHVACWRSCAEPGDLVSDA